MFFLFKKPKRIFLDYATSTPVRKEVWQAMKPYWFKSFANPGTIHSDGVFAKKALEKARFDVAKVLNCQTDEVIFTSGGTESNSLAIFGLLDKLEESGFDLKKIHLITTVMEHPSILEWFKKYEKKGAEVSYLGIDKWGIIDLKEFKEKLKSNTVFVSVMYANNEIGSIQPISKISRIIREKKFDFGSPIFHTDASQAPLYLKIDTRSLGVDMMTIDGQKIYGPKGVGVLFKKEKIKLNSLLLGGSQEMGLRAGTENIPLIVGLSEALTLASKERETESARLKKIQTQFMDLLFAQIPGVILNGGREERLPNNVNISLPKIDTEFAILKLDSLGISCSSKSACMGKIKKHSYVVEALGNKSGNSLRFTMGRNTSPKDIDYVVKCLGQL